MSVISLAWCIRLLESAAQNARAANLLMSFAVTDEEGHLVACHRMDGAGWLTPRIAYGKAFTAAAWGKSSLEVGKELGRFPMFVTAVQIQTQGAFTPQEGGIPIVQDSAVIGAIGASGGTGSEDAAVVIAALAAVPLRAAGA